MTQKTGSNKRATRVAQLIAGTKKHFPNGNQTITLEGASATIDDATKEMQAFVDHRTAVVTAQATARTTVLAERAAMPALIAFIDAFEAFVRLTFGPASAVLTDFGLAPRKAPAPQTAEQKAVAAARRKATREARGTKGPKQKKGIHGNVTAQLVVTPEESSAAPAPAAAPATPGGSGTPPTPHTGS